MPDTAVYTEALDGRPIFLIPWNGQLLVGTTEVPDTLDPSRAEPSEGEIDYLMTSAKRLLPEAGIGWEHVRYAFAGVRPLPFSRTKSPGAITRRHTLHDHTDDGAAGMISVIGGKLTTAAALARDCARKIGLTVSEPRRLLVSSDCGEMESALNAWSQMVATRAGISQQSARNMAEWHGRRALTIASIAQASESMRCPLCEHTSHVVAEAYASVQNEHAVTLADILLRRVPVALGPCWSAECSLVAAQRIGRALRWTPHEIGVQLERFTVERDAFLRSPALSGQTQRAA
jgi:glycerol-3-phosphate dehydrogenase